ncbi:MAG: hypothetical protein NUV80_07470 [Candidatus Berkelbacteria bacterium]|nr:hypothetical protein [Candidatus Berkelbacteria bacterium]
MTNNDMDVAAPVIKVASVWTAVAITSWADFAAMLAAFYTLLLISEWLWKKFIRPFGESIGWIPRRKRRHDDE